MEVMMGVDMVQRQSGRPIGGKLCVHFSRELLAHFRANKYLDAQHHHVDPQIPTRVDQVRYRRWRKHRPPIAQHEMKTDAQRRQPPCAFDGIVDGGAAHHQARCRQNPARVRQLDRFVDLRRQAEIVGRDDQRLQCAVSRRSRRNWKNSIPSRNRRRIISGLRTISPTIDAILLRRK